MQNKKGIFTGILSLMNVAALSVTMTGISADALGETSISYDFAVQKAGYAQGNINLYANEKGSYKLYWANDDGILSGYYPIDKLSMNTGETKSVKMGEHTVIPANATKIVAVTGDDSVQKAVYDIPDSKLLSSASGELLYKFGAYSDIHIDKGSLWYVNAETHLKEGLKYAVEKDEDYIIVSGDVVTNDSGPDKEWTAYQKILSESGFVNPVWESDGNHDLRQGVSSGLKSFISGSGTDSVNTDSSKDSYFYKVEEKTGDVFIFMSIELDKSPNKADIFSEKQLTWAESLIQEYTAKGVNVFLVQHSPIKNFGAGDRMTKPYYSGLMNTDYAGNKKFKEMIQKYHNVIWLSGHTHEDFVMDYNYSNENNTAAHMIHIPSLAGSTMPDSSDNGLERNGGKGFNSQGYYTEVYENEVVFYGANISDKLIYPKYSYIMESTRTSQTGVLPVEQPQMTGEITDISAELAKTSAILSKYYKYASYDRYQALKKLYYEYKDEKTADKAIVSLFEEKISDLSVYTGELVVYSLRDTYYFENNKSWSKVYGYAWKSSVNNAAWPGVKMNKVGTNNGHDVYEVKFSSVGEFENLIFSDGSTQTVDISLYDFKENCFKLSDTTNGKYNVSNYKFTVSGEVIVEPPQPEQHKYALLYYVSGEHDWTDTSTLFTYENGEYVYKFKSKGTENLSFSLYDKTDKNYLSLSASQSLDYSEGQTAEYTLSTLSARGKSITVRALTKDSIVNLIYSPENNIVKLICGEIKEDIPLENTSIISAEDIRLGDRVNVNCSAQGGKGEYQYQVVYRQASQTAWTTAQAFSANTSVSFKPSKAVSYDVCVKVKDASENVIKKFFTVNVIDSSLKNTSTVSAESIYLGKTVTVNMSAFGGSGEYLYAVYYKKTSDSKWTKKQDFNENNVVSVKPAKATAYEICVKVKDESDTVVKKYFNVNVIDNSLKNTSTVSGSTVVLGKVVNVNMSATGGEAPYLYGVYYKKTSDTKWTTKQNFSSVSSTHVKPAKVAEYEICVKVKDNKGTVSKKYFRVTVTK